MPEPKKTSPQKTPKEGGQSIQSENNTLGSSRAKKSDDSPSKPIRPRKPKSKPGSPKTNPQVSPAIKRTRTVLDLMQLKGKQSIVGLTAYDALLGRLVSDAGVDFILVGDSVGTTSLGFPTTIPVTIKDMITSYNNREPSSIFTTDFDLPSRYNETKEEFEVLNETSEDITTEPFNQWFENYKDFSC